MAGRKNFNELRRKMSPEQRDRHDRETAREVAIVGAEMALAEVRKHLNVSQVELAGRMGISQPQLSQVENQRDMYLSTLYRLIEALGGKLELRAHLPDGTDVSIKPGS